MGFLDFLGGIVTNTANIAANEKQNMQNRYWQLQDQRRTEQREDNAVQRRAEDLQAAGLSKTLAAGQGAGATHTATVRGTPSQVSGIMESAMISAQIKNMKKQNELIEAEARSVNQRTLHDIERMEIEKQQNTRAGESHNREGERHNWDRITRELQNTAIQNENDLHQVRKEVLELERDSRLDSLSREQLNIIAQITKIAHEQLNYDKAFREWMIDQVAGTDAKSGISGIWRTIAGFAGNLFDRANQSNDPQDTISGKKSIIISNIIDAYERGKRR